MNKNSHPCLYYYHESSEDDYEQYEEECEWYEEEFPSCITSYNFTRDEGYYYDHVYYEYVCSKPAWTTPMDELEILREICKTLPQQYQAYLNMMGEALSPTLLKTLLSGCLDIGLIVQMWTH